MTRVTKAQVVKRQHAGSDVAGTNGVTDGPASPAYGCRPLTGPGRLIRAVGILTPLCRMSQASIGSHPGHPGHPWGRTLG